MLVLLVLVVAGGAGAGAVLVVLLVLVAAAGAGGGSARRQLPVPCRSLGLSASVCSWHLAAPAPAPWERRGEARRCSAHSRRAMKWIWRSRRVRAGPVSSGSGGGDELRPEGQDKLHLEDISASKSAGGEVRKPKDFNLESSL